MLSFTTSYSIHPMRKGSSLTYRFPLVAIAVLSILTLFQSLTPSTTIRKDGAEPGYTGSPGDSGRNCTVCHGGAAVLVDNWIISDIPAEGYTPGDTYTITAINNEIGATRFGFEVSPQDLQGNYMGLMLITDSIRTKLVADTNQPGSVPKYITYTADGVDGLGSAQWDFKWIAPATGAGEVTFYGGFNSNFEGHKEGDKTYLSTLTVNEKGTSSINSKKAIQLNYSHYPNPSNGALFTDFSLLKKDKVKIDLLAINGQEIASLHCTELRAGRHHIQLQLPLVTPGIYLIRVQSGILSTTKQLIINN